MTLSDKEIRNAGLKVTIPRIKILEVLEKADPHHMSAEDIYKKLLDVGEDVGLATVYRVLTQFERAGLVRKHNFEGGHCIFEIDQGIHHDHLVCIKCNYVDEFIDDDIEKRQDEIAKRSGFKIIDHSLTLYGICRNCNQKG